MNIKDRRGHNAADVVWPTEGNEDGTYDSHDYNLSVMMDLRAVLHDLLDEQKKTNRILSETFGWSDK